MALQRPARLLRFDKMIDNKGLTRIRVGSNCRKMRVFRDHESETGKVPLGRCTLIEALSSSIDLHGVSCTAARTNRERCASLDPDQAQAEGIVLVRRTVVVPCRRPQVASVEKPIAAAMDSIRARVRPFRIGFRLVNVRSVSILDPFGDISEHVVQQVSV